VSVNRTHVIEAQLLEQRAAHHHAAGILVNPLCRLAQRLGELVRQFQRNVTDRQERMRRHKPGQVVGQRPYARRNRHAVVVEHNQHPAVQRAGIVHGLIGHACTHRAIADDRDHMIVGTLQVARHGHAQSGGDRGRGVCRAKRVILALGALGEPVKAVVLADLADAVTPPGQDLVRIGLVAHVPDQPVVRRIVGIVQRHGQLDHPEARPEVTTGYRCGIDGFIAQLLGNLFEVFGLQLSQVGWILDGVKQGS
jgi:hypothetical protein